MSSEQISRVGAVLNDPSKPLKQRFRALFTLRNLGGAEAVQEMAKAFGDKSALLKHEVAYCLGQMGRQDAVPVLRGVLTDKAREAIVRHEAGEALAAIGGGQDLLDLLKEYAKDPVPEVADTCELAVDRLEYNASDLAKTEKLSANPYHSVDPAPPHTETDVAKLREILLDEGGDRSLFERYRAMFSLRNDGSREAILAIAEGEEGES